MRWLLIFVLVVAVGTAVWDSVYGSWGNTVASGLYLVALVVEVFWMPKHQAQLLANADRTATSPESLCNARRYLVTQSV